MKPQQCRVYIYIMTTCGKWKFVRPYVVSTFKGVRQLKFSTVVKTRGLELFSFNKKFCGNMGAELILFWLRQQNLFVEYYVIII